MPRRPRPLCAICADREATTITDWECDSGATRTVVACWPCLSPVPDPPEEYEPADLAERVRDRSVSVAGCASSQNHTMRDAVLQAVAALGAATTEDVRRELGMHTRKEQNHITAVLSRLVKAGALAAEEIEPGVPTHGRIYRVTGAAPVSPGIVEAHRAVMVTSGDFISADLGLSDAVVGHLRRRGLVEMVQRGVSVMRDGVKTKTRTIWRGTGKALRQGGRHAA